MMQFLNTTISIARKPVTTGNKKQLSTLISNIKAFKEDTGTTSDHEQTFLFMYDKTYQTTPIDTEKDVVVEGGKNYFIANTETKEYHIEIRAILSL